MGAFLDKPKTEKHNEDGCGNGLRYGVSSMQGWRVEMEDAHCASIGLPEGPKEWSFYGVFDGHAGGKVSDYCADQLLSYITGSEEFKVIKSSSSNGDYTEKVSSGIRSGFLRMDVTLREHHDQSDGDDRSGSTAVCVLISPTHIYFANCGDSRAVHCRDGKAVYHTVDHKPINPTEKERITNAGGSVMIQRVNGSLAVSRALGDFEYKKVPGKGPCEQLVSPEPEIYVLGRKGEKDEFTVLACDGIWDVMSNEELCDFIRSRLLITDDLKEICNQVVDTCLYKGSRDNMSIVLITYPGAPKVSEEAVQKEKELERRLHDRIKSILDCNDPAEADISCVMHELTKDNIEGLPPGGGLPSKQTTIEAILNKLRPLDPDPNGGSTS